MIKKMRLVGFMGKRPGQSLGFLLGKAWFWNAS